MQFTLYTFILHTIYKANFKYITFLTGFYYDNIFSQEMCFVLKISNKNFFFPIFPILLNCV